MIRFAKSVNIGPNLSDRIELYLTVRRDVGLNCS